MDLFEQTTPLRADSKPLADRMRPRTLDEFLGQKHILGPGKLLRRAIQADQLSSIVLYGPPGSGKTTLARIIANTTRAEFKSLNAVLSGVKDIRKAIEEAGAARARGRKYHLFIDEVHRFNKAQQDALLPHVENGTCILIGATTENPYFEVNKALLSRSRVFQLLPLDLEELKEVARAALKDPRGYGNLKVKLDEDALEHIVRTANGDGRAVLNALELGVETNGVQNDSVHLSLRDAEECIQKKAVHYDKDGDAHFDTISAFIKSIRGSDPDASLYWLAKMIYAGEDPKFIFRRMIISASEDVGLADPGALGAVTSAARAFDYVGLPEGRFHLAQACLYLALAPKSNSTMSFFDALKEVENTSRDTVPNHLKDGSRDGEVLGHGRGYLYPHAYADHWVNQQYLPDSLRGKHFYHPAQSGFENTLRAALQERRELQAALTGDSGSPKGGGSGEYWLDRTIASQPEVLELVRREVFSLADCFPHHQVLDLSGGEGFLTWEAGRRCQEGGVWSLCVKKSETEFLENWFERFDYFLRPRTFLTPVPWNLGSLRENDEAVVFDRIVGYRVLERSGAVQGFWEGFARLIRNHLDTEGKVILCEQDPDKSLTVEHLLRECLRGGGKAHKKLLESVVLAEDKRRTQLRSSLFPVEAGISDSGFFMKTTRDGRNVPRKKHFNATDVQRIFGGEGRSSSIPQFDSLRGELEALQWVQLTEILRDGLPNRTIEWEQGFTFLITTGAKATADT